MKKITLCLIATMFAALSTAQDSRNEQDRVAFNQRMNFNPENMAAWQTGQLQQALQLDSMQYQIIYLMNYADAVTMQDSMKARRERVAKMRAEGKRPERPTEEQMKALIEKENGVTIAKDDDGRVVAFALGIVVAVVYDRLVARKQKIEYTVVGYAYKR